ncbi:hypothetical protein ACLOJK_041761 [Asimina triloba]
MTNPIKYAGRGGRTTHPLIWLAAIFCTVLAIAVIITGIAIFIGYLAIRPRIPSLRVTYARLERINYDQTGQFDARLTIMIAATNENAKAHVRFSDISFFIRFQRTPVAELRSESFDVHKNSSVTLGYDVQSSSIPLEPSAMEDMETSLSQDKITFHLNGDARTRFKIGAVSLLKFWIHLSCQLDFVISSGSSVGPSCSSKSR